MPPRQEERVVQQSVLDRLIDNDPDSSTDYITRAQSVRDLKVAVRRDLEWILNTRAIPTSLPDALAELKDSVYTYGLGDMSSMYGEDPKARARLRSMLERSIAMFEPRLASVQVEESQEAKREGRRIRFTIHAVLKMDPQPERVTFDTVLDIASGEYSIKGDSGAR